MCFAPPGVARSVWCRYLSCPEARCDLCPGSSPVTYVRLQNSTRTMEFFGNENVGVNRSSATFRGQHPHASGAFFFNKPDATGPVSWNNKVENDRTRWEDKHAGPDTPCYPRLGPRSTAAPTLSPLPLSTQEDAAARTREVRRQQQQQTREMEAKAAELEAKSREAAKRAEAWRAIAREVEAQAVREAEAKRATEARQSTAAFKYEKKYGVSLDSLKRVARDPRLHQAAF